MNWYILSSDELRWGMVSSTEYDFRSETERGGETRRGQILTGRGPTGHIFKNQSGRGEAGRVDHGARRVRRKKTKRVAGQGGVGENIL